MERIKNHFVCHCNPEKVNYQEYQRSVPVMVPKEIELLNSLGERKDIVCIDACLVSEIWELWGKGIRTTGCCCGHNKEQLPFIGVEFEDIPKMKELGYQVQPNADGSDREDSFYPKSLIELPN